MLTPICLLLSWKIRLDLQLITDTLPDGDFVSIFIQCVECFLFIHSQLYIMKLLTSAQNSQLDK